MADSRNVVELNFKSQVLSTNAMTSSVTTVTQVALYDPLAARHDCRH